MLDRVKKTGVLKLLKELLKLEHQPFVIPNHFGLIADVLREPEQSGSSGMRATSARDVGDFGERQVNLSDTSSSDG
jgi:hypothetical protein